MRALAGPSVPPPGTTRERARGPGGRAATSSARPPWASATATTCARSRDLLATLGVDVNVVAPLGATPADLARLGEADFNVVLYPEMAMQAALWLQRSFGQPIVKTVPIGVGATREFIREVAALAGVDPQPALDDPRSRSTWYARSVDSTYLTGKRVFVFGDATHAIAAARVAARSSASRSSASAPTAANSRARCATPPSSTASRR